MQFPFTFKQDAEFDVVGFGTNAVDFLIQVPHYPEFNSKVELRDYTQLAGGEVASTMVGLRRLGLRSRYIGRFGSDAAGEIGVDSLRSEGVDFAFAEVIDGARTQVAFIIIDERSGERTVIWKRDRKLSYSEDEVPVDAATGAKVLHLTPHDAAACIRLAHAARDKGVIVSADVDNIFDGIDQLLRTVDIAIVSADFPAKLLGISDIRRALVEMQKMFESGVVGVTLGDAGSLLLCGGEFVETAGFDVPGGCIDTTGAGDAFRAGLIYGLISGESIGESARIANAVAALKCRSLGARTGLPNRNELDSLLKKI